MRQDHEDSHNSTAYQRFSLFGGSVPMGDGWWGRICAQKGKKHPGVAAAAVTWKEMHFAQLRISYDGCFWEAPGVLVFQRYGSSRWHIGAPYFQSILSE